MWTSHNRYATLEDWRIASAMNYLKKGLRGWDTLIKEAARIKADAFYARVSEEKAGIWYVQIKDGIILEPPKGSTHRKLYSRWRVVKNESWTLFYDYSSVP
jgi:hypothetical protein